MPAMTKRFSAETNSGVALVGSELVAKAPLMVTTPGVTVPAGGGGGPPMAFSTSLPFSRSQTHGMSLSRT